MNEPVSATPVSYRDSGVDIAKAESFVEAIGPLAASTHGPEVVQHASRYAGLVRPPLAGMRDPLLAATCDGVGTKLLVARDTGRFAGLGIDLVAMSVNDLLPLHARPLLFLDYMATGKLDPRQMQEVLAGVADGCRQAGCALVGGETAEMPGLYPPGDFDLAGFAVGLVDAARLPDPASMAEGDVVLGLPSSGLHSNGYSLARRVLLAQAGLGLGADFPAACEAAGLPAGAAGPARSLADELLAPTRIYVRTVLDLIARVTVKASAHVTGGGLQGRAEKLLPPGLRMELDPAAWTRPAVFGLIERLGPVAPEEMARTFNLGLGYLAVLAPDQAEAALAAFPGTWLRVGRLIRGTGVGLGHAGQ